MNHPQSSHFQGDMAQADRIQKPGAHTVLTPGHDFLKAMIAGEPTVVLCFSQRPVQVNELQPGSVATRPIHLPNINGLMTVDESSDVSREARCGAKLFAICPNHQVT